VKYVDDFQPCFSSSKQSLLAPVFSSRTEDDRVHFMVWRESQNSPSDALPTAIASFAIPLAWC
jgi:hypothetical protein